jgi:Predicted AAA-ATPase/PD-(D/E)XK nuclease superfamily
VRPIAIGIDDFRKLREQGLEYVDKSHLIREVLDQSAEAILLPRPRRFGKTLNLSMLRYFFAKRDEDLSPLFADLSIWQAGDAYRAHFQRYPVVFLTFKDVKAERWDLAWAAIQRKIAALFNEHRDLLTDGHLSEREARDFQAVLDGTAGRAVHESALLDLCSALHRRHGERVVILIDEYDEPIHMGHVRGYATEVVAFFRAFLGAGLKGNIHLQRAVLTGILRVAKESIFSGLNNLAVYSLLRPEFATCFGFTEPEVARLLAEAGSADLLDSVRSYYNGYVFGGTSVYNPWSILNFIASRDKLLRAYWVSTSSNDLIRDTLQRHALRIEPAIEALLEGGSIEQRLDENVALDDLGKRESALWSLLVLAGYLRAEPADGVPGEVPPYRLSIPNREVREVYTSTFQDWLAQRLGDTGDVAELTRALLEGDAEALEEQLQAFTTNLLSYHDTRLRPEQVYHAFVIGLLATLEPDYRVRSNRESGTGRPDVIILPTRPGRPGVILELKVAKPGKKTPEKALAEGLEQIRTNDYGAELRAVGANPVHAFAVAFDGKSVSVRAAEG